MKSKIQIDVDYENNPIIKIEYVESPDVRDKLIKRFLDQFGYESCWAFFRFDDSHETTQRTIENSKLAVIRPIKENALELQIPDIQSAVESINANKDVLERQERKS